MGNVAGAGRRIGGGLIDLVVTFILVILVGWLTGLGDTTAAGGEVGISVEGWPFLVACLIVFLLFTVMEAILGKTPGKYVAGTRVVDANGDRITLLQSLIRNLLRFIDGIAFYLVGLIIVLVDKENRRLGDFLGKTWVVTD